MKTRKISISILPYLAVVLTFLVLRFGFDFNGLYGQDAHEYLRHGRALRMYFDDGITPPVFHWPHMYSALGALCSYTGISVALCLQLISLFATLLSLFVAQKIFRLLYQSEGAIFLLLGAATQVYFIRSGYFVMSDALCGLFIITCVYYALKVRQDRRFKDLFWVLIFAAAAALTRYGSVLILSVVVLYTIYWITSRWQWYVRILILVAAIGLGSVIMWSNNMALVKAMAVFSEWNVQNLFTFTRFSGGRSETYTVPNVLYIFSNFAHIGYLSIGTYLLIWIRKWNWRLHFLWVALFAYFLFLGGLSTQNQRFLVVSHLIVLIVLFPAFLALKSWLQQRKLWVLFVIGTLVFNGLFFYYSFSKLYGIHRLEKEIVAQLQPLEDDKIIYTFFLDNSFRTYALPNPTITMWKDSLEIIPNNFVVFNPEKFESSWKGSPVMDNWKRMNEEFELEQIQRLPENWIVYRIK